MLRKLKNFFHTHRWIPIGRRLRTCKCGEWQRLEFYSNKTAEWVTVPHAGGES